MPLFSDLPNSAFEEAYFKVRHGDEHVGRLQNITTLPAEFYKIQWEIEAKNRILPFAIGDAEAKPESSYLNYTPLLPVRHIAAAIIGDAIHNYRSALDYAASAVVSKSKSEFSKRVKFPFAEKHEDLIDNQSIKKIERALNCSDQKVKKFFVEYVNSCKDGNYAIWAMNKLNNLDKHEMIIPNVTISHIVLYLASLSQPIKLSNSSIRADADRPFSLLRADEPKDYKITEGVTVEIRFPSNSYFPNESVLKILTEFQNVVLDILKKFDDLVKELN